MIRKYLMYFGSLLGILGLGMAGLLGIAFLYNYIVTTFSVTVAPITPLIFCLMVVVAVIVGLFVLMDKNDYDL